MENKVVADLQACFGLAFHQITPVSGGWLNKKWKITTPKGDFLVKQYSFTRFTQEKLLLMEEALQRQVAIQDTGVPCPKALTYAGQVMRRLDAQTAYMVMGFSLGRVEDPNTITQKQLYSLGQACGAMHQAFSQLPVEGVQDYPLSGVQRITSLYQNLRHLSLAMPTDAPAGYREALLAQESILKKLTPGFFDSLPKGISHEDFSRDNMLFAQEGVAAILDFDRNRYAYRWHDIGRALLSLAFNGKGFDIPKAEAFMQGYAPYGPFVLADLANALRLTWCIEAPWWIQPQFFVARRKKVVRFTAEMLWITEHWMHLEEILGL